MKHLLCVFCVFVLSVNLNAAMAPLVIPNNATKTPAETITSISTTTTLTPTTISEEPITEEPITEEPITEEPITEEPETTEAPTTVAEIITLPDIPINSYTVPYYPRSEWGARDPVKKVILNITQVPYMVVHDSGEPPVIEVAPCLNLTECSAAMKNIQYEHMDVNGWWDIGYSFAIGGDGAIYEGRGWGMEGAHTKYFNSVSIGVAFIGSYTKLLPTLPQTTAFNDLVATGIRLGYLRPDYRLITHGQIKGTLCPGKKLTKKVLTWPHYSIFPGSLKELLDIPDIPADIREEIRKEIVSTSDAL